MSRGFTLVEVLVAMTLLALFLAVLGAGRTMLTRSADRTMSGIAQIENRALALDAMRRRFDQVLYASVGPAGRKHAAFEGDDDRLWLLVAKAELEQGPAISAVELAIETAGQTVKVQMRSVPFSADSQELPSFRAAEPRLLTVLDRPARWSYLVRDDQALRWQDSWRAEQSLPLAIRLTSRDGATAGFFPLRVNLPPLCAGEQASERPECP